jgi:hypothetical protein
MKTFKRAFKRSNKKVPFFAIHFERMLNLAFEEIQFAFATTN